MCIIYNVYKGYGRKKCIKSVKLVYKKCQITTYSSANTIK